MYPQRSSSGLPFGRSQACALFWPCPDAVCSLPEPSENAGTYALSFGALCAVAFEAERERAPSKNIQCPDESKERVCPTLSDRAA